MTLEAVVSALAWSLFGFMAGWLAAMSVRDLHDLAAALRPPRPPRGTDWTDPRYDRRRNRP